MVAITIGETKLSEVCHALFTTTQNPVRQNHIEFFFFLISLTLWSQGYKVAKQCLQNKDCLMSLQTTNSLKKMSRSSYDALN